MGITSGRKCWDLCIFVWVQIITFPIYSYQVPDVNELIKRIKAIEEKHKLTLESVKKAIIQYALRQMLDFDKYKALNVAEQLKTVVMQVNDKKADFHSSVHFTLTKKITKPPEQFKSYILFLLGDRDYKKIVEAINKVDKSFGKAPFHQGRTHSLTQLLDIKFMAKPIP